MSANEVNYLINQSAKIVESNAPGYVFAHDVATELGCTWKEAHMALLLAESYHAPITRRKDGRWFFDYRKQAEGSKGNG